MISNVAPVPHPRKHLYSMDKAPKKDDFQYHSSTNQKLVRTFDSSVIILGGFNVPHINYQGKKIYYEVHGEGAALVILNGIMMSTASWSMFLPELIKGNQVILLDFLDQGRSDKMSHSYKQDLQVEVVKAVVDELKLNNINLLGISYGGEVALQFALKYGDFVHKLLVFNTTAWTNPWLDDIGEGWKQVAKTNDGEAFYNVTIPIVYSPSFYTQNAAGMNARKELLKDVFNSSFLASMIRLIESAEGYDIRDELSNIEAKTLVVGSDFDFITPAPDQLELYKEIPHSTYFEIKNCGHASMYEKPLEFLSITKGYLSVETAPKII